MKDLPADIGCLVCGKRVAIEHDANLRVLSFAHPGGYDDFLIAEKVFRDDPMKAFSELTDNLTYLHTGGNR
jgi:hypothetical protein